MSDAQEPSTTPTIVPSQKAERPPHVVNNSTTPPVSSVTPLVYSGPMISFDFDDGFLSAYQNALPIFNAAGFPTTEYIITRVLGEARYVTAQDVLQMQAKGNEIGAHTQTHPHLDSLTHEQAQNEILGSKQDLQALGISATTFAYPYGEVDPAVEALVKQDGFIGARITKPGFNDSSTDPYLLWYFNVTASTTPAQVEGVIDRDIAKGKWLILVFHMVDDSQPSYENVSHAIVQTIVDYVKSKQIRVVTNEQGLRILPQIP